uniref:Uncharacterized protein n=1 Tax=Panagrolaimus davidi TaxID=227884 RepID=A0A914QT98_9BILA
MDGRKEMKLSLFFISFLLLPYLTQLIYVPNCGSFPLQNALKPPIHVAAIIESDAGTLGTKNHAFFFLQILCALNEQHSKVQTDGWKVDNEYKTCTNINSDNPTENIIQSAAFSSPPEHSRTLCEILEVAKKCAKQYNKNAGGTEKLHIIAGLLLHDEIGNCKIEEMFPTVNFHLTIFWVHGHRKPPSVHSEIIDYAILESITDITPKDGWIMPEVSLEQLKEAQEAGNGNPIFDSLYLRLKRMSDNAKGRTTTRKSRRSQRTKEIQLTTPTASMSSLPSTTTATTSPMMTTEILLPEKSNLASFLFDCQTAAVASKSEESGNIKKRFADDNEMFSPCLILFLLRLLPGNSSTNLNNYGKMVEGISATHISSADYNDISSTSIAGSSDTTVTSTISTTTEETTVAPNITSSTESFNANEILNTTKNAAEEELSFLEKFGEAFGNKNHGILYLLLIILFVLLVLCGISILIYCLWPKTDHYDVHSKTKPSDGNGNTVAGKAAAPKDGTPTSTESAKKKKQNSSNKDAASSNKNSNVNKKTSDVSSKKSPVKSILTKSPHQKLQNPSKKEAVNQQKPITSHSISSLSDRSQTNIEIPPPPISPAGITPAPSALSLVENTNMKFNDNKNFEAPPELQPPGINNNNNNPLSLY